jgi:hypothetical protein
MESGMRSRLVKAYVWAIVLASAVGLVWSGLTDTSLPAWGTTAVIGAGAFTLLGLFLQLAEHRLSVSSLAGSVAFIVYLGAALVLGRTWGGVVTGLSLGVAQSLARKRPIRIAFNVAQHVLAILLAATLYESLGGAIPPRVLDASTMGPYAGMVIAFFTINSTAVSGAVALSEEQRFDEVWLRSAWSMVGYDLIASALGLVIAWLYSSYGISGIAIVVVPILFLRHAYLVNVQLQATNRELLELMVKAIEARDPYTSGHSQRVAQIARFLAMDMGLQLREVDQIATAALLHDVGKIYEEFAPILRKEGRLTQEERQIMHSHPIRSAELVGTISNLRGYVHRCVRHHHENFDGSGYPDGIAGTDIPVGARIILVADTTDAMTTDRPYRKALAYERVVDELEKLSGRQFDPHVVAVFKRCATVRRLVGAGRQPLAVPTLGQVHRVEQLAAR